MHREILLSETYQLASEYDDRTTPPSTRTTAGSGDFHRRRLDAESIRDAMLAVSGRLDPGRPGPPSVPADRGLALDPAQRVQDGLSDRIIAAST